jgi:hypothetical protein
VLRNARDFAIRLAIEKYDRTLFRADSEDGVGDGPRDEGSSIFVACKLDILEGALPDGPN